MPAGRPPHPTLLTPELVNEFARLLPVVLYLETVGDYLGISRETWRTWLRRGRKENDRLVKNPTVPTKELEQVYLDFFVTHKRAIAKGEIRDSQTIRRAAKQQWQAAAWRLERRFPDRWGSKTRELAELEKVVKEQSKVIDALVENQASGAAQREVDRHTSNGRAGG